MFFNKQALRCDTKPRSKLAAQSQLYLAIILVVNLIQTNNCQLDGIFSSADQSSSNPRKVGLISRQRRFAIDDEQTIRQQAIPAANPNFEAAFQGECGKNNNSNPCEHICLDLHDGTYECSCFYGFTLAVDGYSCTPLTARGLAFTTKGPVLSQANHGKQLSVASEGTKFAQLELQNENSARGTSMELRTAAGTLLVARHHENDNRKLLEELARGAESNNSNENAGSRLDHGQVMAGEQGQNSLDVSALIHKIANSDPPKLATRFGQQGLNFPLGQHHSTETEESTSEKLAPQMTTAAISRGLLDDINKEYATDTWTRYDVDANDTDGSELNSGEYIDEIDPDIKSIIMSNDKLVEKLELLLSLGLNTNSSLGHPGSGATNKEDKNSSVSLLERLVRKTIEDYARPQTIPLYSAAFGINRPFSGKKNRSSTRRSRRRVHSTEHVDNSILTTINMLRLPSANNDAHSLCPIDVPGQPAGLFRDCDEMPECESGGQCGLEMVHPMKYRARCRCPIGRGGYLCQKPIQRAIPRFSGQSYLALPMITDRWLTSLRMVFKPERQAHGQSSLVLYSRRFLLLLDSLGRLELRYLTDDGGGVGTEVTRVIGSRDVQQNRWNELIVSDASSDSQANALSSNVGDKIVLVTPDKISMGSRTSLMSSELFLAGLPSPSSGISGRSSSMLDSSTSAGFIGCIKELSINQRNYNFRSDLNGDALDGLDVGECCEPMDDIRIESNNQDNQQ